MAETPAPPSQSGAQTSMLAISDQPKPVLTTAMPPSESWPMPVDTAGQDTVAQ